MLSVRGLKVYYHTYEGVVKAVDGVDLDLDEGEKMGILGESGCGKTTLVLSIMRLVPSPGRIVEGKILFQGEDLLAKSNEEMRKIRGRKIAMIFQDPASSFDPAYTVGYQISEVFREHLGMEREDSMAEAIELMKVVGIPDAEKRAYDYPHQFSTGMLQRAMIAMMMACNPSLLIADEPTRALDATIQLQILDLIAQWSQKNRQSILAVGHDIGVLAELCDKMAVMYAGRFVEVSDKGALLREPLHPYTKALLKSSPRTSKKMERISAIRGEVPSLIDLPSGCKFHPRCLYAKADCKNIEVPMRKTAGNRWVRCLLYE